MAKGNEDASDRERELAVGSIEKHDNLEKESEKKEEAKLN